ncbi:sulfatase-like hydrolase/transferase [Poseidonocella sp. HB161398]|uniref:sulfatase-like hydrolase/transferase n=1 Tax=Poseidonocella sp. HB161398 TaxID=2320855 RepID=UPI001108787A|nr:sulfatase-like hydrolase/transferase [Poseidonocella sp. HB161398]
MKSRAAALAVAAILAGAVLVLPNHPSALGWQALRVLPLELPVLLLGLLATGSRRAASALAAGLVLLVALKLADIATFAAFARSFDPVADLHLVTAGLQLLAGSIGAAGAALAAIAALAALLLLGIGLSAGLRCWARAGRSLPGRARAAAGAAALAAAALCVIDLRGAPADPPGTAFSTRLAAAHLRDARRSRAALSEFRAAAAADPWQARDGAFGGLAGRDVAVVFVESYGRAAFDNPLYAARHRRTMAAGAAALQAAGLQIRSGWLASPVQGGQSWLAHGTLASGLTLSGQLRYGALLKSPRLTLFDLAREAGYATLAVAPAITMPWPEGPELGFDKVLAAADLGYAGPPFDWVTMPDQYTLAAFDRLAPRDRPLMAEIALISSHAPWTPVAEMLPWEAVGDGRAFAAMAAAGPAPREVWADRDRVRDHYGRALDYALQAVLSWAALPRARVPLLIVLGDHQPAGFVAQGRGPDVPVHLIGPPEVLALFDGWGWTPGPEPAPDLPAWPMAAFRDRFLAATGAGGDGGS